VTIGLQLSAKILCVAGGRGTVQCLLRGVLKAPKSLGRGVLSILNRGTYRDAIETLLTCDGFPEPFLRGSKAADNRWASVYHQEILRADVRDAFAVRDLDSLTLLYDLLVPRVGSPLSVTQLPILLVTANRFEVRLQCDQEVPVRSLGVPVVVRHTGHTPVLRKNRPVLPP